MEHPVSFLDQTVSMLSHNGSVMHGNDSALKQLSSVSTHKVSDLRQDSCNLSQLIYSPGHLDGELDQNDPKICHHAFYSV